MTSAGEPRDRFAAARAVADAVLYEGYVLYPYRASARKNQLRWQFGVLVPPDGGAVGGERSTARTEVVVDPGPEAVLDVRVRALHVQRRIVERARDDGAAFTPAENVDVDGVRWTSWDEAVERQVDLASLRLLPVPASEVEHHFAFPGGREVEVLRTASGEVVGRVVRETHAFEGTVRVGCRWCDAPGALLCVSVEVANTTGDDRHAANEASARVDRDALMARSLVGAHVLLAIDDGAFVSSTDPPEFAAAAVGECENDGLYPVLMGEEGATDVVLASPIILYDHPSVAPESAGQFCDATEIDEILALRVLTLTDDEKAEARGTDARAAHIIDRCDTLPPDVWTRLHGAVRSLREVDPASATGDVFDPNEVPWWDPGVDASVDPSTDTIVIGAHRVGRGTRVRLVPSRRADAHDLFLRDCLATVVGVFHDVDGSQHLAVTLDDDPASDLAQWQGRFRYFHPDEVEVVEPDSESEAAT